MSERRTSTRRKISLAAQLDDGEGGKLVAVARDASESGILLLAQVPLPVGSAFRLNILQPSGGALLLIGRVARCERLELEYADVWKYKIGVELIDPPTDLPATLDAIIAAVEP